MAVSDAAAQMQLTYDRQVVHNQTLVAKFSDIMTIIGDANSIKYTPDDSESISAGGILLGAQQFGLPAWWGGLSQNSCSEIPARA